MVGGVYSVKIMTACQVKRMNRNELNGIPRPWPELDNKHTI